MYLLSLGMSVNMTDNSSRSPLLCACLEGDRLENVKTLVEHGALINQVDKDGKSALHFAATFSSPEVVRYLLSRGMSANMTDNSSRSPLLCACLEGDRLENVITLVKHGAKIHKVDKDGKSALHFAATFSSPEVIMFLLFLGMSVNMTDNSDRTPLMCACLEGGRFENVKTLVKHGAEIYKVNKDGKSALHFAATFSSPEVVRYLLSRGMSANMTDNSSRSPLMCACLEGGRLENIKTLVEHGAEIHKVDKDGKSALHFAATFSSPEVVIYLLSLGMSVNMTDNSGRTPLMCACLEGGRFENVKTLVEHGAKIHKVDKDGKSALHFAATFSSPEVIMYLLSLGMSVNMTDKSGLTPMMTACLKGGRLENVKTLVIHGAEIHKVNKDGKSALHFAATFSSPEVVKYLLSRGMSVNMTDNSSRSPLLCACLEGGRLENIKTLVEHGAEIHKVDKNGKSALHFAATFSCPEVVKYLLSRGMSVNMTDNSSRSPLLCACLEGGRLKNIKTLVLHGAEIHKVDIDGKSVLHFAATFSSSKVVKYLLSTRLSVNMTDNSSRSPLMCACLEGGRFENIKTFIERGADIYKVDKDGKSALHFAATFSSPEVVKYLLSRGMSVNMTDNSDRTPLMCACLKCGRLENIKMLIEYGADITH